VTVPAAGVWWKAVKVEEFGNRLQGLSIGELEALVIDLSASIRACQATGQNRELSTEARRKAHKAVDFYSRKRALTNREIARRDPINAGTRRA
jgi:hypothetical protein